MILDFLKDFLSVLWSGVLKIFTGIFGGLYQMFNFKDYATVFNNYTFKSFGMWVVAILCVIVVVAILIALVWLIIYLLIKLFKRRKNVVLPDDLVDEVASLKRQIVKLSIEKERILGMKISGGMAMDGGALALGSGTAPAAGGQDAPGTGNIKEGESRFYKLTEVDRYMRDEYVAPEYDNEITLEGICDRFRNFACANMRLFYENVSSDCSLRDFPPRDCLFSKVSPVQVKRHCPTLSDSSYITPRPSHRFSPAGVTERKYSDTSTNSPNVSTKPKF